MRKTPFLITLSIIVLVVVGVVLGKSNLFMGNLTSGVFNYGASVLIDSARGDTDFDGVLIGSDKCPDLPPYQVVFFQKKNSIQYLGRRISLETLGTNKAAGSNLNFDVDGTIYSVEVNKEAYVPPASSGLQGFLIKGLFASKKQSFGIVVIRRADVNLDTGCPSST